MLLNERIQVFENIVIAEAKKSKAERLVPEQMSTFLNNMTGLTTNIDMVNRFKDNPIPFAAFKTNRQALIDTITGPYGAMLTRMTTIESKIQNLQPIFTGSNLV
jgi:hypothetical protein